MQAIEVVKEYSLPANGAVGHEVRCWLPPIGEPFRDVNIAVTTAGGLLPALGVDWIVYYGGYWAAGTPFDSDATHAGGITMANGTMAGGAEIATNLYNDTDIFPSNLRVITPNFDGTLTKVGFGGFPIVLYLHNNAASVASLNVTLMARTVSIP